MSYIYTHIIQHPILSGKKCGYHIERHIIVGLIAPTIKKHFFFLIIWDWLLGSIDGEDRVAMKQEASQAVLVVSYTL